MIGKDLNLLLLKEGEEEQIEIDTLIPLFKIKEGETQYDILIKTDKDSFYKKFNSVSELYKVLSKSNQTVRISSPTKNYTNRKWWDFHFIGGVYVVYQCDEYFYIHFKLDRREYSYPPSELQVKKRVRKAFEGLSITLWVGVNNKYVKRKISMLRECYCRPQNVGN
jgi:hypothetical protein